jgi:hypothetical protein
MDPFDKNPERYSAIPWAPGTSVSAMSSWPFRLAEKRLVRFSRCKGALAEKWRRHANSGRIDDRPRGRGINEQFSPCLRMP